MLLSKVFTINNSEIILFRKLYSEIGKTISPKMEVKTPTTPPISPNKSINVYTERS